MFNACSSEISNCKYKYNQVLSQTFCNSVARKPAFRNYFSFFRNGGRGKLKNIWFRKSAKLKTIVVFIENVSLLKTPLVQEGKTLTKKSLYHELNSPLYLKMLPEL